MVSNGFVNGIVPTLLDWIFGTSSRGDPLEKIFIWVVSFMTLGPFVIAEVLIALSILFLALIYWFSACITSGLRENECVKCGEKTTKRDLTATDKIFSGSYSIYGLFVILALGQVCGYFYAIIVYTACCLIYALRDSMGEKPFSCVKCTSSC